jgi:hypothetical protein
MKWFLVSALVVVCLVAAGVASAGIPSASTSTVEREGQGSPGTCDPDVAVICPASDIGWVLVTVTVRNVYGDPLPGKVVNCYMLTEIWGDCEWCPGENPQTGTTDGNGQAFFYFHDGGGCCEVQFGADCEGVIFNPSPLITIISPDRNADLVVNLTDFILFAGSYFTSDICFDFNCDGIVDLSDFIIFAAHYNHTC